MSSWQLIRFYNNWALSLLLLLIPVIIGFWISNKIRQWRLESFARGPIRQQLLAGFRPRRRTVKRTMFSLGLFFLILAIARPQFGTRLETVKQVGVDIVFALDLSYSMLAEDIKPNRLLRSKNLIEEITGLLTGDRIALVPFAGTAHLQCPLTTDYSAFKMFLDIADVNLLPIPGTSVGNALEKTLEAFGDEADVGRTRLVILITDGEEHDQEALKTAEKLAARNISILTVGIGSPTGAVIPILGANGEVKGHIRDSQEKPVITKLNDELLIDLALETGGRYYPLDPTDSAAELLVEHVSTLLKSEIAEQQFTAYEERFQLPGAVAVLLFSLSILMGERRKGR